MEIVRRRGHGESRAVAGKAFVERGRLGHEGWLWEDNGGGILVGKGERGYRMSWVEISLLPKLFYVFKCV